VILFDTNIVSELMRPQPNPAVLAFAQGCQAEDVFLPSLCEAELRYGIMRLLPGRRRGELEAGFEAVLVQAFAGRILAFDSACARAYATLRTQRERAGRPIAVTDLLIGGMALAHGAALATRNLADFDGYGLVLVDPWT